MCLLVTTVSCDKTDEPIEIPFRIWTRVNPRNPALRGVMDLLAGRCNFEGHSSACTVGSGPYNSYGQRHIQGGFISLEPFKIN